MFYTNQNIFQRIEWHRVRNFNSKFSEYVGDISRVILSIENHKFRSIKWKQKTRKNRWFESWTLVFIFIIINLNFK